MRRIRLVSIDSRHFIDARFINHVPIIDDNPRRGVKKTMNSAQIICYHERSSVWRLLSHLENYGSINIRVHGRVMVMDHLMFDVVVETAMQLFNLLT